MRVGRVFAAVAVTSPVGLPCIFATFTVAYTLG